MYDNILHQNAALLLEQDIERDAIPSSLLFTGAVGSGKLTSALETARVLACTANPRGQWTCECPSCRRHKLLLSQNMVLAGFRDCTPEIFAAKKTFLNAVFSEASYLDAARYLFLRSVRKLTARFNPVLWEGDDKVSKIAGVVSAIDENIEVLDFPREIPEEKSLNKIISDIEKNCVKLENEFLPDSIPIRHIRNVSAWAHVKSNDGKKTFIIENADRMLEGVRNALLKILEEPPEDTVFILTATRRNAVMPTILSRVRTYQFEARTMAEEMDVISRVFHDHEFVNGADAASLHGGVIEKYFEKFLPVEPAVIRQSAHEFCTAIADAKIPDVEAVVKSCAGFEPRKLFKIFLTSIMDEMRDGLQNAKETLLVSENVEHLRKCMNDVTIFNESPVAALESLVRSMSKTSRSYLTRR